MEGAATSRHERVEQARSSLCDARKVRGPKGSRAHARKPGGVGGTALVPLLTLKLKLGVPPGNSRGSRVNRCPAPAAHTDAPRAPEQRPADRVRTGAVCRPRGTVSGSGTRRAAGRAAQGEGEGEAPGHTQLYTSSPPGPRAARLRAQLPVTLLSRERFLHSGFHPMRDPC